MSELNNFKYNLFGYLLFAAVLIFHAQAYAAESNSSRGSTYRIGAGDVINLTVLVGGENQIDLKLVVSNQGEITIPFAGKIVAAGITANQLEKSIYIPLEQEYFRDPQVHVMILGYHSLQFFISGAVKKPGMYEMDFNPTVIELIAKAGGVVSGRGNVAYIFKGNKGMIEADDLLPSTIESKKPLNVDLLKLLDKGDLSGNIILESGDTIYIPLGNKINQTGTKIYVDGRVKNPSVFDYQPGLTALSAVIMAGGLAKYAAPNRTRIIRKNDGDQEIIKINLEKVKTGDLSDVLLQPDDRVHVPESWL